MVALWNALLRWAAACAGVEQVRYARWCLPEYVGGVPWAWSLLPLGAWGIAFIIGRGGPSLKGAFEGLAKVLRRRPGLVALAVALLVSTLSASIHYGLLGGIPHVHDSAAYLFQARIFAAGRLTAPAPPPEWRPGLSFSHCAFSEDRWFSAFWFAWPAVLAVGVLLGVQGLVNPLLMGVFVLLLWRIATRIDRRGMGLVVLALAAFSPFLVFMGASGLSHPFCLVLVTAALVIHSETLGREVCGWHLVVLSLLLGVAANVRPVTALVWMGPLWCALALPLLRKRRFGSLALSIVVIVAWAGAALAYNYALTGSFLTTPMSLAHAGSRYGFGRIVHWGEATRHSVATGVLNFAVNGLALNEDLLGLTHVSLLLPLLGLVSAWRIIPRLWLGCLALHGAAYFAFFHAGTCFGSRYYFETLPLLLLLSAAGVVAVARASARRGPFSAPAFLCLLAALSVCTYWPRRLGQMRDYWDVFPDGPAWVRARAIKGRVVAVPPDLYRSFFPLNGPFLDGANLYWNKKAGSVPRTLLKRRGGGRPAFILARSAILGDSKEAARLRR